MPAPHLCLNMIVRNESARIIRALDSARPYISTFAILDTGSTDNTVELIREWGVAHGINGIVGLGAFANFSQARNDALKLARSWLQRHRHENPLTDYILLMDADMELVVDDPDAFEGLSGEMFHMIQKAGSVSYHNARLLSITSAATYEGVTHEYLAATPAGTVSKARFIDHADGSNRIDKFERDIRLLLADLERDSTNPRTWFYLAGSYRDAGNHAKAIEAYRRRIQIGGWDEETWSSRINLANELDKIGMEDGYIKEALGAIQERPQRAEPFYALAKHYREKGQYNLAAMFAKEGLGKPRPDDLLFIEDWVYEWGLREELSISGFFVPELKERSFLVTNGLAIDPRIPDDRRGLARRNMVWHLQPLKAMCPSVEYRQINAAVAGVSPGFVIMNPCVANKPSGDLEVILRTVNYKINEQGQYMIGEKGCQDAPIVTENYLLLLSRHLSVVDAVPVVWHRPSAQFPLVIGLEDMRIFWHKGQRQFTACVREQSAAGVCDQYHGYLHKSADSTVARVGGETRISDGTSYEKNWAALSTGTDLKYVYRLDKIIENDKERKVERAFACDNISGSSPWIRFRRGWVSVVHEAIVHPSTGKRVYQHRFAYTENNFEHMRISLPFVFQAAQIEFCAGLANHPNGRDFVLSFGVRDEEAWLATVHATDVANALRLV